MLKKSTRLPPDPVLGSSSHTCTVQLLKSPSSPRPTASNSTPRLGSWHLLGAALRYAVNDVAGSATGSVVIDAGWPDGWMSPQSVPVSRPVPSDRTSKSKVCTLFPGVADPQPSWMWPLTSAGGGAPQVTVNVVVAAPLAGTVTVCGLASLTLQFAATPDNATGLAPSGAVTATPPFVAIGWLFVPSIVTVYPSGSRLKPVVLVVTVRLPLPEPIGAQLSENVTDVMPPAVTVPLCGFAPLVQFCAAPERVTECVPVASPVNVTLPFVATGWLEPSTKTV